MAGTKLCIFYIILSLHTKILVSHVLPYNPIFHLLRVSRTLANDAIYMINGPIAKKN